VESKLLLANYLLCSQGDRMGMAHSVEGRFPFLDHRVVEFAARIPVRLKMRGLNEKYLLKKAMRGLLPAAIVERKKQPYMAPDILSFFWTTTPPYVDYLLSPDSLNKSGLFNADMVVNLVAKCRVKARQGFRENMALVGILSTQCLYDQFIANWRPDCPLTLQNTKRIIQ
jgi:asparagine synthase (glutamine-hydrolysing)